MGSQLAPVHGYTVRIPEYADEGTYLACDLSYTGRCALLTIS